MPELRQYRYFVEVARQGTFTAAAEALHMTQSAISEQILQLEREFGCLLFERQRLGIKLTPAGEYLLPQAEALLQRAAEAKDGLARFRQGYQDRIRIGSILGPLQSWVPAALAEFSQLQPQVQIQVDHQLTVDQILDSVSAGRLDVGIVTLGPTQPARSREGGLQETPLLEEDLGVVAPAGHPVSELAHVTPEDLRGVHLITFPASYSMRQIIEGWFRNAGLVPLVAAETGLLEVTLRLVGSGLGVAVLPRSLGTIAQASGLRFVAFAPGKAPRRSVLAVRREGGPRDEAVTKLIGLLEVHARLDRPVP
jgi:DNA-binding transcriptional LysR family regulator